MTAESRVSSSTAAHSESSAQAGVYSEGLVAGLAGAATIAVWFLLLDTIRGHPLYTPAILGTALFRHGAGLESPQTLSIDSEVVLSFTWVHVLVFLVIGFAAARLLGLAERNPNFGFGIVILFVVFEFGFVLACMVFAEPVLRALTWPEVMVGNLFAAAAMAAVFWRRHPRLAISP